MDDLNLVSGGADSRSSEGFANEEAMERWFEENDSEGVAFEYEVLE
jgi:hypothetical protein